MSGYIQPNLRHHDNDLEYYWFSVIKCIRCYYEHDLDKSMDGTICPNCKSCKLQVVEQLLDEGEVYALEKAGRV